MKQRLRRWLASASAAAAIAGGGVVVAAAPAEAAGNVNVWINIGHWNCVAGGRVTGVWGAVDGVWSGGDWGDNVIYPRAQTGRQNVFNGRAYCDRPWYDPRGDYYVNIVWRTFWPTYNGQAFYF